MNDFKEIICMNALSICRGWMEDMYDILLIFKSIWFQILLINLIFSN